jgi:hypothetical protein
MTMTLGTTVRWQFRMADAHILALAKGGSEPSESNQAAAHSTISSCERLVFDLEADQHRQGDLEALPPAVFAE